MYITNSVSPRTISINSVEGSSTYHHPWNVGGNDAPIILFNQSRGSEQVSDVQPLVLNPVSGDTASNQMYSEPFELIEVNLVVLNP